MNVPSVYEQSNPKTHTVYVSGLPDDVTEKAVLEVFVAFGTSWTVAALLPLCSLSSTFPDHLLSLLAGDILEIQLPKEKVQEGRKQPGGTSLR